MLNGHGRGDLHVEVKVQTPSKLGKRQRELLQATLASADRACANARMQTSTRLLTPRPSVPTAQNTVVPAGNTTSLALGPLGLKRARSTQLCSTRNFDRKMPCVFRAQSCRASLQTTMRWANNCATKFAPRNFQEFMLHVALLETNS